jgi:hypothetical protein
VDDSAIEVDIWPGQAPDFTDPHPGEDHSHDEGPPMIGDLIDEGGKLLLGREVYTLTKWAGGCVAVTGFDSSTLCDVLRDPALALGVASRRLQVGQNLAPHR